MNNTEIFIKPKYSIGQTVYVFKISEFRYGKIKSILWEEWDKNAKMEGFRFSYELDGGESVFFNKRFYHEMFVFDNKADLLDFISKQIP